MAPSNKDLLLPLLGTEVQPCEAQAAAPVSPNDEDKISTCWDHLVTLGLAAVLLFQFGIVFVRNNVAFDGAQWTTIVIAVALFTVSTVLYQMAALEAKVRSMVVILLPEIIAVAIVALISFNFATMAFYVLINGILTMALAVVIYSANELARGDERTTQEE